MNTKKLIILASILLTVCLNLDAFIRRDRVASRRGAIAGGYGGYRGPGYGYAGTDYGVGTTTGRLLGGSVETAGALAATPLEILS